MARLCSSEVLAVSLSAAEAHQERQLLKQAGTSEPVQICHSVNHSEAFERDFKWHLDTNLRSSCSAENQKAKVETTLPATLTIVRRKSGAQGLCQTCGEIAKGSLYLHDTVTPLVYYRATSAFALRIGKKPPHSLPHPSLPEPNPFHLSDGGAEASGVRSASVANWAPSRVLLRGRGKSPSPGVPPPQMNWWRSDSGRGRGCG